MAVFVFMYHGTLAEPRDPFEVTLPAFQEQIDRLIDGGVHFIRFSEAFQPHFLERGTHVAITFDDGHGSNAAAIEYLAKKDIKPSAFIVRDWSKSGIGWSGWRGYLTPPDLRALDPICDFGAHGASHRGLATLSLDALDNELSSSRSYLEHEVGHAVTTMSLPGGDVSAQVIERAEAHSFLAIGNSTFSPNWCVSRTINRLVVGHGRGSDFPLSMTSAPRIYWSARRLKSTARRLSRRLFRS